MIKVDIKLLGLSYFHYDIIIRHILKTGAKNVPKNHKNRPQKIKKFPKKRTNFPKNQKIFPKF